MDKIPRLTGSRCACRACGHYFNSTSAFDMHRVGDYADRTRRCRTLAEMLTAGMSRNDAGFWITSAMPKRRILSRTARAGAEIGPRGHLG